MTFLKGLADNYSTPELLQENAPIIHKFLKRKNWAAKNSKFLVKFGIKLQKLLKKMAKIFAKILAKIDQQSVGMWHWTLTVNFFPWQIWRLD